MTSAFVALVQRALVKHGFKLLVDGVFGKLTSEAIIKFKKSKRLRARDYVGPLTEAALFQDRKTPTRKKDEPVWLRRARQEVGVKEIKGRKHNPRILWYWAKSKLGFKSDEIPWCAGFVGAILEDVGIRSTRSGMARSYTRWGRKLTKPVTGAIVVFWRGSRGGTKGHVGIVSGVDKRGRILVLGGNQSDAVNIKPFDTDRVLGYYWPHAVPIEDKLIVKTSYEKSSTNEA